MSFDDRLTTAPFAPADTMPALELVVLNGWAGQNIETAVWGRDVPGRSYWRNVQRMTGAEVSQRIFRLERLEGCP